MSLANILKERAKKRSSKIAMVCGNEKLTYNEWHRKSNRLANALLKRGITKDDRVVILIPTNAEFMVSYLGVMKSGAWATPIDVRFSPEELDFLFQDCQPKAIISVNPYLEALKPQLYRYTSLKYIITQSTPVDSSSLSYSELLNNSSPGIPDYTLVESDIAHLRYSSGTTGRPKATLTTHANEQAGARMGCETMELSEKDVFVLPLLPPSWFLYMVSYIMYASGTAVIVPETGLSPALEAISHNKGTAFLNIPPVLTEMLNMSEEEAKKYNLSSLRVCLVSGMPLRYEVARQFRQRFGISPISFLGYTETTSGPAAQPVDGSGKPGATGRMLPGWEYKIVDEAGQILPPNQVGELVFRSPAVVTAYYNRPQATAAAFHDGWFFSGDMGLIDEDNYLFLMGRKKEIINIAGKEIFPLDIEEVLLSHPQILEAAAVEIPGKTGTGVLKIAIVPKKGAALVSREIMDFCKQHLNLTPEEVEFRESLPRTASGKVRRASLKELA